MAAVAAHGEDGAYKVYREIYQDTSSGDFGIQVVDGPLFRCHTYIISKCGGFIHKVRRFGRPLQREVKQGSVPPVKDYFKAKGYTRLLQDLSGIQFSQPMELSSFQSMASKMMGSKPDPLAPGYTTAHFIGGTTGAVRRSDQFMLAERYEVDCDCELLAELLRYIYQGVMSFFHTSPQTDKEKEVLTHKMLKICLYAEKYSIDSLYEQLLVWFGSKCFPMLGDSNFADAFYSLEHAITQCTEDHSREALVATVTGDMLASREQFRAVTRDPRWRSLPIDFVEHTLVYDGMPISSESEVLNLIERWNANADKSTQDLIRLLRCFRVDEENKPTIQAWMRSQGWISTNGGVPDLPQLKGVREIVTGAASKGKKPRRNLAGAQLAEAQRSQDKQDSRISEEEEATFVHYRGASVVGTGHTFELGSQQRLVQMDAIHSAGVQRLRIVLCSPRRQLWDPEHEVFVGCSYGEGRYFGYLCSATAFSGIFSVRALASAAPAPNAPVHLTGSGNKVEFDMTLEVQLHRVNMVVMCKLSVVFANKTVTEELFQIAYNTLSSGPGLRYQVVATGLGHETVDVSLGWVSTRMASEEKEAVVGPLDFQLGD